MIYGVYIVSKSGGLIFNLDHNIPKVENEKVFNYPIDLMLDYNDPKKVSVTFGQKEGINGKQVSLVIFQGLVQFTFFLQSVMFCRQSMASR